MPNVLHSDKIWTDKFQTFHNGVEDWIHLIYLVANWTRSLKIDSDSYPRHRDASSSFFYLLRRFCWDFNDFSKHKSCFLSSVSSTLSSHHIKMMMTISNLTQSNILTEFRESCQGEAKLGKKIKSVCCHLWEVESVPASLLVNLVVISMILWQKKILINCKQKLKVKNESSMRRWTQLRHNGGRGEK